jgi:hypothetical protein
MVLFFTITLGISIVGLVSLLSIKQWELQNGVVLLSRVRPKLGSFFHTVSLWIERILPTLVRVYFRRTLNVLRVAMHRVSAWGVLTLEHALERLLQVLRKATSTKRTVGEASVFLREVAEHKRKLLKNRMTRTKVTTPDE